MQFFKDDIVSTSTIRDLNVAVSIAFLHTAFSHYLTIGLWEMKVTICNNVSDKNTFKTFISCRYLITKVWMFKRHATIANSLPENLMM